MIKIADPVPARTRLPLAAWVGAGIATLLSTVSSLVQLSSSGGITAMTSKPTMQVTELLGFLL